ncbi:MurR/RpiR family transcriptional regulator [Clostridium sp. D53t1_180928_C8]|uniref:MurR/RpiR family transcriptional regulator n=1 Tax=Clostridium sp. D53t1_180928_C8 TaxID=2787101 RepID=UPI0018A9D2E6|nr:MurR/RpiR family transcriptional regulator [Clostridium sp. D53t1_180928_C8]
MSILMQLDNPNFKTSKSDKQIIEYIRDNAEKIIYMTISESAKKTNTGEATVTRFAKKMGFSGFQDFKVTLAQEISLKVRNSIINNEITNNEDVMETANKLLKNNINVLEGTVNKLNSNNIYVCADLIKKSTRVYFMGIGYSGIVAQDSNYKFMRIGINSVYYSDTHTMVMMSALTSEDEVVFVISHSGETEEIIRATKIAKENGSKIISITENENSTLAKISDINLSYISSETLFESGAVSSKLAQIFIVDLIYTQVVKETHVKAVNKKIKTTEAIYK